MLVHAVNRHISKKEIFKISITNLGNFREPCFDLIVKSENVMENERYIYKFWIQNLSNEIYEKIIDGTPFFLLIGHLFNIIIFLVYYKTMNMFIFVYNVSDRSSFEKIEENYEHIKSLAKNGNLNFLLIGMHFSPKHKIVRIFSKNQILNF